MDEFGLIAQERRRLADTLDELDATAWATPSLCAGWSNHVVAAHLNLPWAVSTPKFLLGVVRSRGNIDKTMDGFSRRLAADLAPEACVVGLRANAEHRFTPPGLGPAAPLTDVVMHGGDILRTVDRTVDVDPEALRIILAFVVSPKARRGFGTPTLDGFTLEATDTGARVGAGPAFVSGPTVSLCGAVLGRATYLADLEGDGVAALAALRS